MSTRYFGMPVPRLEDPRLLTGGGRYVDDIDLPGMLHAAFLRSPVAHGLIRRLDLAAARACGAKVAVLEIPLLLETGGAPKCDAVAVVSAPAQLQRERVLARPGMTAEKLDAILARQMPDAEKRARADFVVDTGGTIEQTLAQVDTIIDQVESRAGTAFERCWR